LPFDRGLPKECTLIECGKFYRIINYIIGDNQLLGYRSGKVKPLTIEKISKMFCCTERQARKFIKKMKDISAIKEVTINDVKWYAVNPLYALRSKYLSSTAFLIFQDELLPVLPNWAIARYMEGVKEITDKVEIKG